jgi:ABC-type glutathione transport system ATPase component
MKTVPDPEYLLVKVRGLTKTYGRRTGLFAKTKVEALRGVDFKLENGAQIALVGASGSGKSTFARCLTLMEPWDGGEIRYTAALPAWQLAQLIPQNAGASLNPRFAALEAIEEPLRIQRRERVRDRALQLLDAMELARHGAGRRVSEFSGGERARIALARALALGPRMLILDETLTSLDPDTQIKIAGLLERMRRAEEFALVTITHDLALAMRVASEIAVFDAGRIVERLPARDFLDTAKEPQSRRLIEARPGGEGV